MPNITQVLLLFVRDDAETPVWHTIFVDILIETRDGVTYVNGSQVEPIEQTIKNEQTR